MCQFLQRKRLKVPVNMSASLTHAVQKITAVVVTGGSSGIGKSFITQLYYIKPQLAFCNLSRSKPEGLPEGVRLEHVACNLSDANALTTAAGEVRQWLEIHGGQGEILLINNSGFGSYGPFQQLDSKGQLDMVDVNVRAPVALTANCLPHLLDRGGCIINIASVAAYVPTPSMATYGATKAFLQSWSLSLNEDLRGTKVRTLCVCPGPTKTNFFQAGGFAGKRLPGGGMTTEAVVRQSLLAFAQERTLLVNGLHNRLMTAMTQLLPRSWLARASAYVISKTR